MDSRQHDDPLLVAAVAAFRAQLHQAIAFQEDGDTNADQFYFEGAFRLAPVINAIVSAERDGEPSEDAITAHQLVIARLERENARLRGLLARAVGYEPQLDTEIRAVLQDSTS